ncbi:AMP-binding enzyme domain-containing protein [Hirsutella rhossiliensis]|uniref:AMP-binding enzyme domain-containing protein n=1 Tax=Hirsutella rhossiliensis TaxID=111463 RepID=A0A9P8SE74_9HYPO|nr:AMP-binding enzyme domain-containing protein [Hirsutella rhossiliensis]KAH0959538.1 AMP-binding enzyme domain-containing protein [Hirsutella rhossiliensis]
MNEPIAIIGTACRFPGSASSPSKLWELLKSPRDVVRPFTAKRLNLSNFYSQNGEAHGRTDVQQQSYLLEEDVRLFDAAFFLYEAFEAAGLPLSAVEGSQTSVHVGVMTDDYYTIQARDPDTMGSHAATGLSRCILSNRVSYAFDLRGPSMTVDTACSSSLVALHLAVQSLRKGEASQAVVGGTSLLLDPHWFVTESSLHMLSPDSRSRMWDIEANGYARGEGCAAVILKPLSKAIQHGDHIECIIRETSVNSDGRTNGLTMPCPKAQAALIRQTYQNAGLDPVADRCQYFECHGTGTQAGDPVEARAINDAFFPPGTLDQADQVGRLYCGSIKTIVGHLEGCAGLAGLLRASLAIQHQAIPPNMYFNELNPSIKPFYANLCVPTSLLPWPETHCKPRRASVNSFGFGARSRTSLARSLGRILDHLRLNQALDLDALGGVLHSNRTAFSYRVAIPAVRNCQQLIESLEEQVELASGPSTSGTFGVRALNESGSKQRPRILGIFTGQGAQAAQMGRQLLAHCTLFRQSIDNCEAALASLPEAPTWSLRQELAAEEAVSRLSEASISQPLCTAVQIALVDLLQAAGIQFATVVGHSSGEIGAAYAAGLLDRRDAMAIAYYRGHVAHLAQGPGGKPGGMMAAALTFREAKSLCSGPRFGGRLSVAAGNAPSSVTLSGDLDAIEEIKGLLDARKVQARQLRVDTAYHSHHMFSCAEAYLEHLKRLNVAVQTPPKDGACVWFSSVRRNTNMTAQPIHQQGLEGQYWVDNMVQPVLFSEAVQFAVQTNPAPFAVALEVGPHPALRGPVSQTLKPLSASPLPYAGCLERDQGGVESMSAAIGMIWSYLGPSAVDFGGWREAFGLPGRQAPLKDLPSYAWDHDQIYWRESRLSHNFRVGGQPPHNLLGRQREDSQYEKTWRNFFHLHEMPWVKGHVFQGQVLFPGAGYVSLAVEASKAFVQDRPVKLLEVRDMNIPKALVIGEDNGIEILFTIRSKTLPSAVPDGSILEADFVSYSCSDERVLDRTCNGHLLIHLGRAEPGDLPPNSLSQVELTPLSTDRFYRAVSEIELDYGGVFRTLHSIGRSWGHAKASASWPKGDLDIGCSLHPALLDVAFQTGLGTFVSTAEKSMGSPYLPIGIKRAIIDPNQDYRDESGSTSIDIEALMASANASVVEVDISICAKSRSSDESCGIQIDGLILKAIAEPQPSEDRNLFVKTIWDVDSAYGLTAPSPARVDINESAKMIDACERVTLFYMQNLELSRYIHTTLATVREGKHAILRKEWLDDDRETITRLAERYSNNVDIEMLVAVGENLPSVVRKESGMMEHMLNNDLLGRLYKESNGLATCNRHVADLMRRISHKHPRTKILEIGAGTGGTTVSALNAVGDAYSSYTCTDISASFFNGLSKKLPEEHTPKVDFEVFNAEKAPAAQGFTEGSYDVVIAANVLHATRRLSETVQNARALLRPGGYLIAIEVTGTMIRETGLMGGEWDRILEKNGFSGVDCIVHDHPDVARHSCSVFATQAIDDRLNVLRDPLFSMDLIPKSPVLILGGRTLAVSKLARRVAKMLRLWSSEIRACDNIDDLDSADMLPGTFVLCLSDLDKPFFSESPTPERLDRLQGMLGAARNILWVTCGRMLDDPYSNMMVGIGRALAVELPHVNMHYLDFERPEAWSADVVVRHVLRMAVTLASSTDTRDMLWAQEPETLVKGNELLVPRIVPDHAANETLNAKRRRISKLVDSTERITIASQSINSSEPLLVIGSPLDVPERHLAVDVKLSVALHAGHEKPCFLCFGHVQNPGHPACTEAVFALSATNSSAIVAHAESLFTCPDSQAGGADALVAMASALIASQVLPSFPKHGTTLVCGATGIMAESLATAAAQAERKVLFVAVDSAGERGRDGWIVVHPRAPARVVQKLIPRDTLLLLNFSEDALHSVLPCLPKFCAVQAFDPGFIPHQPAAVAAAALAVAYEAHKAMNAGGTSTAPVVTVVNIAEASQELLTGKERLSLVLDWERQEPVSAVIQPLEANSIFSVDKTYFLVGMAGELGQSLCRFMIRGGARYIVLASRNPAKDPHWLTDLRSTGADVRIVKMDVTDQTQVRETVAMLRQIMPEIGGVANAALVFEAGIFVNFSADNVARQLKPKVDGTLHLDHEFASDNLEFFLTFGSLATVCGNPGQAMYHAGNMFMSSLVEKRRQRGQAASILNFGLLVDVGYVARMDRADGTNIEGTLRSLLLTPLSEAELHHLVLQGIISGRPGSASGEVIMGMAPYIDDGKAAARPPWVDKTFFSHMIHAPMHLRENLDRSSTIEEATEGVKELFYKKIESMIKVPRTSIDANAPLADLGLDSLHGIDIRKWLLEDLKVNIPLLRILAKPTLMESPRVPEIRAASDSTPGTPTSSTDDAPWTDSSSDDGHRETNVTAASVSPSLYKRSERLSFAQAGIHFLHTFLDDPTSFNVTTRYAVRGRLNVSRLAQAIEKTLSHHEAYQTCFFADSGSSQVKQHVASNINLHRFRHVSSTRREAEEHARNAFDSVANAEYLLASGEAFRAVLVTHEPERHTLVFGFHLMASDALSFSIFLRDLDRAYQMLPLSSNTSSYLDYTRRQHDDVNAHRFDEFIAYWKRHLNPVPTPLPLLPIAQVSSRHARRVYRNHIVERELGVDMARRVRGASQACGATSMQFYLAAMQVLLARLANVDDVCIGVADSGRSRTGDFADSVGHFANILPVRFQIDSGHSFEELLNRTSHSVLSAFDNSQVPFDLLLERLGIERSPVHTPLFQVAFNYRVGDILQRPLGDCILSMEKYVDIKTPYDFVINVTQTGSQGHLVECITSGNLYSKSATEFITDTFIGLVESLTQDQSARIRDCKLFSSEQVERAIALGRGPATRHPWPKTLPERFQQVVSAYPGSIAIKDADEFLTYSRLARRVGLYASSLLGANAGPGSRVAVLCEPSIDIYAAMLAILHIGAVYVPLDISLPDARRRSMMKACRPDMLVFHAATTEAAMECSGDGKVRTLDLSKLHVSSPPIGSLPALAPSSATRDSFLLFTSGSTGTPKGIRLGQGGIMNYAASKSAMLGLGQVRVLQQTSSGFDMAIAQAFNAFANGGTLVVAPSKARGDPSMISQIMLEEGIEFTLGTPSEYLMLTAYAADTVQRCTSWRYACSGGEVVSERLVRSLRRLELPSLSFTDWYGPTEVSCATTFRNIRLMAGAGEAFESHGTGDGATSVVGKAISNTSIYIVSEDGKTALPTGMPGEICIGGGGVARGYLDADLSRDKFVADPFATPDDHAEGRAVMYKTGDKGYLQMDGSLAFLGRANGGETVVKLRGLRIDLNEVSNAILAAAPPETLADAIVTTRGEPQFLVAYVALARGRNLDPAQLDMLLGDLALPRYMIPSMIVPLDHLPITTNGKIDRAALQALPLPARHGKDDEKAALTVPEGELRVLWQGVLGEAASVATIGPYSDFFTVGGSSLLLVRLQNALRERTGVALSLQELYQATTLRKMAAAMHQERGQLAEETIDWKAETAIPSSILEAAKGGPSLPQPQRHRRQVLLTGAGTFLGGEILRCLMENDDVARVHCVAVSEEERQRLASEDKGKMVIYAGSMMSPTLGLSGTETAFLKSNIDQMIHAAVQGHCMNNYTSVKQALYVSTQTLVGLALPRRVPFHFVSAPRVVLLSGQHEGKPVSMAAHLPPTDGSQGVTASKWASECFLEKVARETALPVVVHRHCALIGERAPADDVMNSVVRFSLLTRKVPHVAGAEGFFDFKDVVAVASEIERQPPAPAAGPVCFRHHSGDMRVPFGELAQRLGAVYGGSFEVVEPSEWLRAAAEFGMEELLVIHLRANMESGKPMVFPYLGA